MPTLAQIEAATRANGLDLAQYLKPRLEAAQSALQAAPVMNLIGDIDALRNELPEGEEKIQLGNVLTVLTSVPSFIGSRIAAVDADIAAATPPE